MKFSLIIPVFNEEGNIGPLVRECFAEISPEILGELIVVDDCSNDGTRAVLAELRPSYPKLRVLRHKHNSGQSAALRSGVKAAKYDVIAQLDGDGQNDPADLETLLGTLDPPGEGNVALVGGVREKRRSGGSKRLASRLANQIRDWALADGCPDTGCGTKVYWRSVFLDLPFFTSIHRYLPALFQAYGHQCRYVAVNDRPRLTGVSKYTNWHRALIGIQDLFGVRWLRRRTKNPETEEI